MSDFTIRSISAKGDFELLKEDTTILYTVDYRNWYSSEATSKFGNSNYMVRPANIWQTQFEFLRNEKPIGRINFNWKGEIVLTYNTTDETEKQFLFRYKGVWKFRFILSDDSGKEILVMASSWSKLKYHYDITVLDEDLNDNEVKELLMACGYSANLYMNSIMSIV